MTDFIEYNKTVLGTVGMIVNEENIITTYKDVVVKIDGLPLALPTDANINKMTVLENGKMVHKLKIFNPYSEDVIKKNPVLIRLADMMSTHSSITTMTIINLIILLLGDESLHDKIHSTLQRFIIDLRVKLGNKGKLVTHKTEKAFEKLMMHVVDNQLSIIQYLRCKGKTINGVIYNRTSKLDTKVMDGLADGSITIDGISERDMTIINSIIEFIAGEIKTSETGSKSNLYPSYMSLAELYIEIHTRLNFLLDILKEVSSAEYEAMTIKLFDPNVEKYHKEISYIPGDNVNEKQIETATTSSKLMAAMTTSNYVTGNMNVNTPTTNSVNNQIPGPNEPASTIPSPNDGGDPLDALRARSGALNNTSGFINTGGTNIISNGIQPMNNPGNMQGIAHGLNRHYIQQQQVQQQQVIGNLNLGTTIQRTRGW